MKELIRSELIKILQSPDEKAAVKVQAALALDKFERENNPPEPTNKLGEFLSE